MISCRLTCKETPSIVILDSEWLSLLLTPLVHPDPSLVVEEGILLERAVFEHWMSKELLPNAEACRCFLLSLSDMYISQEDTSPVRATEEAVVVSPHALSPKLAPGMSGAVNTSLRFPHAGWRAKRLMNSSDW